MDTQPTEPLRRPSFSQLNTHTHTHTHLSSALGANNFLSTVGNAVNKPGKALGLNKLALKWRRQIIRKVTDKLFSHGNKYYKKTPPKHNNEIEID